MEIQSKDIESFQNKELLDNVTGMVTTSVQISPEFFKLCKIHDIKFVEAMRTGISILLAEKGIRDYDNKLVLVRRIRIIQEQLSKNNELMAELEERLKKYEVGK